MKHILLSITCIMSSTLLYTQDAITVIGVGRFGICAALCFEAAGYKVLGIDINRECVANINNKTFTSLEPGVNELLQASTRFKASHRLDEGLSFANMYYIAVDTPTKPGENKYDHTNLNKILVEINNHKVANKHIIIASTVFPGYIATARSLIKDCANTTLSYNPSFIAQGDIIKRFRSPDIVLIGEASPDAGTLITQLHKKVCKNTPEICRMNPESAEITKLAINCFITTKIAFANMIGDIADNTDGADKCAILAAIGKDSRIGSACLNPGYGFGGPCFPRDNRALGAYASQVGISSCIPHATDDANKHHADFMAQQLLKEGKDLYTFESVTYKDNCPVPIIEESQKLAVAAILAQKGKRVLIIDTEPVIYEVRKKFGNLFEYELKTQQPHE